MNLLRTVLLAALLITAPASASAAVVTLSEAWEAALRNSEVVSISAESMVQSSARVDQAGTYLYPRLTGSGAYTRYNEVLPPEGGFVFQPLDEVRASLVLNQPLYTGGRTLAAWRAARGLERASRHEHASVRQAVLFSVAEAYHGVLKARSLVEAGRRSLERMERHRKVTEREAATRRTKANASALLRADTLVTQARISLRRAEDGLLVARQRLSLATRLPAEIEVTEPEPRSLSAGSLEQLQQAALGRRDDHAAARLNEQVARESVTITRGGHLPQVYAEGGVRYTASDPDTQLDGVTYYGGIRLQAPLFEGGLMRAETAEARSRLRQAELSTALLKRRIEAEVQEAYIAVRTAAAVREALERQFSDARANFEAVEGLFAEGLAPSLSLIDAEQALSLTERELITVTWDERTAIIRLEQSLGLPAGERRTGD